MSEVAKFFDRQADSYLHLRRGGMWPFHQVTARRLEAAVSGKVLAVGGLWAEADLDRVHCELTVVDISETMLEHYKKILEPRPHLNPRLTLSDAANLEFADSSFDHVILPLVLHHITGRSGWTARSLVRQVLGEARRVLQPGGRVWISDFSVAYPFYALELLFSPLARFCLQQFDIPLTVMHHRRFYESALRGAGFEEVGSERVRSKAARPLDIVQPVTGLTFVRLPRFMNPLRPTLITGRASR